MPTKPTANDQLVVDDLDCAAYVFAQILIAPVIERNGSRCIFKFPRALAEPVAAKYFSSESFGYARARRTLCWELHRVRV